MKMSRLMLFVLIAAVLFLTMMCLASCTKRGEIAAPEKAPGAGPGTLAQPSEKKEPAPPQITEAKPVEKPAPVQEQPTAPAQQETQKAEGAEMAVREGRTSPGLLPVYFAFDEYTIPADMTARLENNAKWLKANPEAKIRVEGNCDERGSNDYNIALGQRRADTAKEYLSNLGISPDRIETLSYGKEKPLASGHDEEAWRINRRDDFLIVTGTNGAKNQ